VEVIYDDFGKKFGGNTDRLGELFYKFNSSKGSGIGLYLIKNLMRQMHGQFHILNEERLRFKLCFSAPAGEEEDV
jgi:signal transduction histidine kinase